ncbi:hypothetical protein SpCBS45565_g07836 [Spizellomyces sp. 'palustris']|nr:hypothetical protein SpCBS45565_g07836 [Spizellomyces sp. 'palustris']
MPPSLPTDWQHAHASYSSVLRALCTSKEAAKGNKLQELDNWMWNDLHKAIVERGSLTRDELVKVMEWKLSRGKFRPTLLAQVSSNPSDVVIEASQKGFSLVKESDESILAALKELAKLKGVGPATASALLSAYNPSIPFMSDEALSLYSAKLQYTVPAYKNLLAKLRAQAAELNKGEGSDNWTAGKCERAVWAWCIGKRFGLTEMGEDNGNGNDQGTPVTEADAMLEKDEKRPAESNGNETPGLRRSKRRRKTADEDSS